MKKKILAFIITVTMMIGFSIGVYAADQSSSVDAETELETCSVEASGKCGTNVTWSLSSDGVLTISGKGAMTDYTYKYDSSSQKMPWFDKYSGNHDDYFEDYDDTAVCIRSVVIGSGVTHIGNNAFRYCVAIKSVSIPGSVTSIGNCAFADCGSLENVSMASGVKSIGGAAFSQCVSLKDFTIPDSVTTIGDEAFAHCLSLTKTSIPKGLKRIEGIYMYCSGIKNITIPTNVKEIGGGAFSFCDSVTSIYVPDSVTKIEGDAFSYCINLTSIRLPAKLTRIQSSLLNGCTKLSSITIPKGVTLIDEYAFYECKSLKEVTIPTSVTKIDFCAFTYCSNLVKLVIPASVTYIDYIALDGCNSLTVYCYSNSFAHKFCKSHGIKYKLIGHTKHTWGSGIITKKATVLTAGVKTYRCTVCGLAKTYKLNKLAVKIKKGKTYTLNTASFASGSYVKSIRSSKSSVASIKKIAKNKYRITGKKKGSASITVKLKSGKTATCKVTVK